jgi:hypothetical protein
MSLANTVIVGKINFPKTFGRRETYQLETLLKKSYKWVLELAIHKSTDLPYLDKVTIEEDLGWPGQWEYPEDLSMAFETAEIHLNIQVA